MELQLLLRPEPCRAEAAAIGGAASGAAVAAAGWRVAERVLSGLERLHWQQPVLPVRSQVDPEADNKGMVAGLYTRGVASAATYTGLVSKCDLKRTGEDRFREWFVVQIN